ncbi:hypothetical protein H9I32_05790 [Bacillus sp. Xin]|uniref:hypothetical protein n=1 Tax=unclassified Bacillus (in: firmicutes) TaxID=185979 RepID=UPI001572EDD2|nr:MULTISPECIES: hypothetical protein [unclassified Bacillus (in: firmicutes)]MBC6971958.1 hypothetical protein [Bacillus sp. Xin]NSW39228.1 hypothetical protein [Bacillus sp. Xin1]
MKVLLREDIANRWAVSKERMQELAMDSMFPKPYMILPSEESLYLETDIIAYERLYVELTRVYIRGRNLRSFL